MAMQQEAMLTKLIFYVLFLLFFTTRFKEADAVTSALYAEEGGISQLACPSQRTETGRQITSVRWTMTSKNDRFVARLYEDGSQYCPFRRFSISNSSQTTLVINGTEVLDEGIYRCLVRYRELAPSVRNIKLTVYAPFVLELEVLRSSDIEHYTAEETPRQVNLIAGNSLTVNCTARMTRPPIKLTWTFNGKEISRDSYSNKTIENEDYFTTTISLAVDEAREEHSGLYICVAYYGNTKESVKFRTFLLNVQESSESRTVGLPTTYTHFTVDAVTVASSPFLRKGLLKNSAMEIPSSNTHYDNFTKRPGSGYGQTGPINTVQVLAATISALVFALLVLIIITVVFWKKNRTIYTSQNTRTQTNNDSYETPDSKKNEASPFLGCVCANSTERSAYTAKALRREIEYDPFFNDEHRDQLELTYKQLQFSDGYLGRGEFGVVRKALLLDDNFVEGKKVVAVKCLRENASCEDRRNFLRELEIMKSLQESHPNVITLLGYCTKSDPICIIVELAPNGNLQSYLVKNRCEIQKTYQNIHPSSQNITSLDLLLYAWQIANGMGYIAARKLIHRDLASRNILLGEDRCCKISDFGFARDVSGTDIYEPRSTGPLPIRWMALESLLRSIYTTETDVWSYGIVLWEITTLGATPYQELNSPEVIKKLRNGYRLPKPHHCDEDLYRIMRRCWNTHPESRPSFSDICVTLAEMRKETRKEYLTLRKFDGHLYVNLSDEDDHSEEML